MRFINELHEGDRVSGIYLCKQKQSAMTKNGKPYDNVILQDKTGVLDGKIWDPNSLGIDDFDTLFSQMEETQKSGYSFEKEESNKDVQCIAVPVKYKENVIAGMSVAVPVFYYSEEFEKKAMEELKKAKQHIEKLIQDNTQEWVYSPLGTET